MLAVLQIQGRAGRLLARLANVDKILINSDDVLTKLDLSAVAELVFLFVAYSFKDSVFF